MVAEPRFILRSPVPGINPGGPRLPSVLDITRNSGNPETGQFVAERAQCAGENLVGDRSSVASHGAKRPIS